MVQDHFATLGVERAAWLDPDQLKARFLAVSSEAHPDKAAEPDKKAAEENFKRINEAYNTLRNTRTRVLHLLELMGVPKRSHVEVLPPVALELFAPVAEVTKRADALLKEKAAAASPMLKVQSFQRRLECVDALQKLQGTIQERIQQIENGLKQFSPSNGSELQKPLQEACAALGFLERWSAQLQERAAALSFE